MMHASTNSMHVAALQPSLSPQSVTRRATVANDGEFHLTRPSGASIERAVSTGSSKVDPSILKKLSASVSHFEGPRKNLSFVVSVERLIPGRRAFSDERESCQLVARSFDDFRHFRKSLLLRVGSIRDPTCLLSARSSRCRCEGHGCPFDVTRTFLERLKFTRMPFLSLGESETDLNKRQQEMDNFLHIIFAILHRMQPGSWHPECRFLQDVMTFLEVEESFTLQMELMLRSKNRHMNLDGWKAYTLETFGSGIGI